MLFGKPLVAHMYMKRIPMEDLPKTEAEQETFLRDMFVEKDKLRDSFLKTGDFFATSGVPRIEPFELPKRMNSLFVMLFWSICTVLPLSYYLVKLLLNGELLYFSIGASIFGAFYLLLNKTIGMSEIKKGSSYGTTTTPKKTE
ncbi:hypothetical protein NQ314_021323 [Rhamnusium bicolor]|uniref:Acyltransferase C-terminal domain-containing protein n=1 Tax=Rhamnusium bicolor TaxID=1586634 RepID=A0AAV8WJP7_9CUCU|nr:hypothetical protein NQ314_021323 [Rhamnusium bicolor]